MVVSTKKPTREENWFLGVGCVVAKSVTAPRDEACCDTRFGKPGIGGCDNKPNRRPVAEELLPLSPGERQPERPTERIRRRNRKTGPEHSNWEPERSSLGLRPERHNRIRSFRPERRNHNWCGSHRIRHS
jgi:hypothetical protein